jgi:hypothetical protein
MGRPCLKENKKKKEIIMLPGVVVMHTCNPSTLHIEAEMQI